MFVNFVGRNLVDLQFAHNVILVHVDAAELPTGADRSQLKYYLNVYVQDGFGSSEFKLASSLVRKEEPPANESTPSEGAFFSINEILLAELQDSTPDFSQPVQLQAGMTLDYYTEAVIMNGPTEISRFTASSGKVINAGDENFENPDRTYFSRDFSGWLSPGFSPFNATFVLQDQPVSISFLANFSNLASAAMVGIKTIGDEEEMMTFPIDNPVFGQVYSINILPEMLGNARYFNVYVFDNLGNALFQPLRFVRMDVVRARPKNLIFLNNFRVPEVIGLMGDTQESMKISRFTADFATSPRLSGVVEREVSNTAGNRNFSVRLDTIYPSKIALESVLLSPKFWLFSENELQVLNPTFSDVLLKNGADELQVPLTFELNREEKIGYRLPSLSGNSRPTAWRIFRQNCELDAFGRRSGRSVVTQLEEYYIDDNSRVIPRSIKANVPGTTGYIEPYTSETCALGTTPFLSAAISRIGSFSKNDCETGYPGTKPTIVVPAGAYGSELSQADADAKAEAFWRSLDTQATANASGSCPTATPGLFGQYHNFFSLGSIPADWKTRTPAFTRVDNQISFFNNFDSRVSQWFAVRWIGVMVGPFTGSVTFSILNDYKFILRLDGQVVINLQNPSDNYQEAVFQMVAGRNYNVEIEFQQDIGNNLCDMRWRWPGQSSVAVPTSNLFNYGSD